MTIYSIFVYLMTLLIAQKIQCRMIGYLANNTSQKSFSNIKTTLLKILVRLICWFWVIQIIRYVTVLCWVISVMRENDALLTSKIQCHRHSTVISNREASGTYIHDSRTEEPYKTASLVISIRDMVKNGLFSICNSQEVKICCAV
jgi:hypothetical protein